MNREELITFLNPKGLGIEIGVQSGHYSEAILSRTEGLHLIVLDSWRHLENYPDLANSPTNDHLNLMNHTVERLLPYEGRFTLIRELSETAVQWFKDELFDYIYMDANHSESFVYLDLVRWWGKLKPGGIMSGHDYVNLKDDINDFGVKDAVDKFFAFQGVEVHVVDHPFPTWYVYKPYP